jgi:outer membrane cobalamin receptor
MTAPYASRVMLICVLMAAAACARTSASSGHPQRESGRVITREQIRRSGAVDAWQALRHFATFLEIKENRRGDGGRVYQRGRGSFLLSSELMLVVDEIQVADFQYLKQIPAETVDYIRVLRGAEGTAQYGTGAGNGVVVVRTAPPPDMARR